MAAKNWLIRTTQNQILGPVSKQKIIDLVRSGKLEEDDEVCSGNGYWFYIKEDDLVEKYLLGDIPQGFNPVYEMEPILTRKVKKDATSTMGGGVQPVQPSDLDGDSILPDEDDLEYPDIEINIDEDDDGDITMVGKIPSHLQSVESIKVEDVQTGHPEPQKVSAPVLPDKDINLMGRTETIQDNEQSRPGKEPSDEDLEYPDLGIDQNLIDQKLKEVTGEVDIPNFAQEASSQEMVSESSPVEIFDDVDRFEDDGTMGELDDEPSDQEVRRKVKKKSKPTAEPKKKEVTKKKKKSAKSSEFKEVSSKGADDEIEKALSRNEDRRGHSRRGRRRGVDTYLILIVGSLIIILIAIIFYYKKVLKKPLPFLSQEIIEMVIPTAEAQSQLDQSKKKA